MDLDPAILFFSTIIIVFAMLCWTAVIVTKKVVAYKTLSLQMASHDTLDVTADDDTALPAPQTRLDQDLTQTEGAR